MHCCIFCTHCSVIHNISCESLQPVCRLFASLDVNKPWVIPAAVQQRACTTKIRKSPFIEIRLHKLMCCGAFSNGNMTSIDVEAEGWDSVALAKPQRHHLHRKKLDERSFRWYIGRGYKPKHALLRARAKSSLNIVDVNSSIVLGALGTQRGHATAGALTERFRANRKPRHSTFLF